MLIEGNVPNSFCRIKCNQKEKDTKSIESINPDWNDSLSVPINIQTKGVFFFL